MADGEMIELLAARDGRSTRVVLNDGRRLDVRNIAWGYDEGDTHAHITTNISPSVPEASVDYFYTHEVAVLVDAQSEEVIYEPRW